MAEFNGIQGYMIADKLAASGRTPTAEAIAEYRRNPHFRRIVDADAKMPKAVRDMFYLKPLRKD